MKKVIAIIIICGLIFSTLISVVSFVYDDSSTEKPSSTLNN